MFNEGDKIGPYTLIRQLGRGGLGEVWLAERGLAHTRQAIKIPISQDMDREAVINEAKLWNKAVPHDHIVQIYEAEEYDGYVVLASEYHPDGSLEAWLKKHGEKPPGAQAAVELMRGILAGVDHLHTLPEPIVHKDLKPANILMKGKTPRIADFGIARLLEETWRGTNSGTPLYMAPEAIKGGERSLRTDVWSLGVIFYQLVAGRLPFPDVGAIVTDEPLPVPVSVQEPLKRVILRALQKDKTKRFGSAGEMLAALEEAVGQLKTSEDFLKSGRGYYQNRDYDRAIAELDQAIGVEPDRAEAYYERGKAYFQRAAANPEGKDKDYERALKDFSQAINLQPDLPDPYHRRAKVYGGQGRHDLAVKDLDRAISLSPHRSEYYLERGKLYGLRGDHDSAISDFSRAIELKPDQGSPYYNRLNAYIKVITAAQASAVSDFNKYKELDKNISAARLEKLEKALGLKSSATVAPAAEAKLRTLSFGKKVNAIFEALSDAEFAGVMVGILLIAFALFMLGALVKRATDESPVEPPQETQEKVQGAENRAQQAEQRAEDAEKKAQEAEKKYALAQDMLDKNAVWWVAKVENRMNVSVTYQANLNGPWENYTLEPGRAKIYWRKYQRVSVKFDYDLTSNTQYKEYVLQSSPVVGHEPSEREKAAGNVNYFLKKTENELELFTENR